MDTWNSVPVLIGPYSSARLLVDLSYTRTLLAAIKWARLGFIKNSASFCVVQAMSGRKTKAA